MFVGLHTQISPDAIDGRRNTSTAVGRRTGDPLGECGPFVSNFSPAAARFNPTEPPGKDVCVDAARR